MPYPSLTLHMLTIPGAFTFGAGPSGNNSNGAASHSAATESAAAQPPPAGKGVFSFLSNPPSSQPLAKPPAAAAFAFGLAAAASGELPGAKAATPEASAAADEAPKSMKKVHSFSSLGPDASAASAAPVPDKPMFAFGVSSSSDAGATDKADKPAAPFSFGGGAAPFAAASAPFSFGSGASTASAFGSAAPSTSLFAFGAPPSSSAASSAGGGGGGSTAAPSLFSFGGSGSAAAPSIFGTFNQQPPGSAPSIFGGGAPAAAAAATAPPPAAAGGEGGDGEEDEGPKVFQSEVAVNEEAGRIAFKSKVRGELKLTLFQMCLPSLPG